MVESYSLDYTGTGTLTSVTLHATTTPTAGRYTSGVKSVFSRKRLFTTRYLYGRKKQTPVLQY